MARMLADRDSTDLHINLASRHQRLARRYKQASLVTAIQSVIDTLVSRQVAAAGKDLDRQAAYDDVIAADADLDDGIRNLFGSAEAFDRDHIGAGMVTTLFPDGGFGYMVDQPMAEEPASAEALATKIDTLGASHALAPHSVKLKALGQGVRDALKALDDAVRLAKNADAEEEIAQGALRRQYEHNYLIARQTIGRGIAERLFPKANRGQSAEASPAPTSPAVV